MGENSDFPELLLRAICESGGHAEGAVVDIRPLLRTLDVAPRELFATIVKLVDGDLLEYLGAGPVVRLTALGAKQCGHRPRDSGPSSPSPTP